MHLTRGAAFLGRGEVAGPQLHSREPASPHLGRSRPIVLSNALKPMSCHRFINSGPYSSVCFVVLSLTEPTSSFELFTVGAHLLGEWVEYRIGRGRAARESSFTSFTCTPLTALICGAEHAQEPWRGF